MEDAVATLDQTLTPSLERVERRPSELHRIVVRLVDGELVQIGTAPNRDGALALARDTIASVEAPDGEWPLVGDRILNPEAVVSVDVVPLD
jgi:hypothetical protein